MMKELSVLQVLPKHLKTQVKHGCFICVDVIPIDASLYIGGF
jgi:hypothetical protein